MGRLDEITEDGEDAATDIGSLASAHVSSSSLSGAQRYKAGRRMENLSRRAERADRSNASLQVSGEAPLSTSRRSTPPASPLRHPVAQDFVRQNSGTTSVTEQEPEQDNIPSDVLAETGKTAPSPETVNLLDIAAEEPADTQQSATGDKATQSSETTHTEQPAPDDTRNLPAQAFEVGRREEIQAPQSDRSAVSEASTSIRGVSMDEDPYDLSKYDKYFKPKVKLGPRPVTTAERAMRAGAPRVSAVPASLRNARKQEPSRPKSQGLDSTASAAAPAQFDPPPRLPPPIPVEYSPRPYSRGSVKSAPSHRSSGMTPDRLRLMKAVELRKRQLRKSQEQSSFAPPIEQDAPEMPKLQSQTPPEQLSNLTIDKKEQNQDAETEHSNTDDESKPQSIKADSGIEIRYDTPSYDDVDDRAPSAHEYVPLATAVQLDPTANQPMSTLLTPGSGSTEQDTVSDSLDDAISLTDSYTPTEKTVIQQQGEVVPTIEVANHSRPTTSDGQAEVGAEVLTQAVSVDNDTEVTSVPPSRPASSDLSKRRRGLVEPLQVEIASGNPDDFMSDDDFLEELHSATVEEARPIFVARSPLSGSLPKHQPSMEDISAVRSVSITRNLSNKVSGEADRLSPEPSPALLSTSPTDTAWNAPRKVSSGISKRIQALNEMSTREASVSGHNLSARPLTPEALPNTFLQRDLKGRGPRKAPSPAARPVSFRRLSKNSSANQTPATTPSLEHAPIWTTQRDTPGSRNSVSVTARIVRPQTDPDQEQLIQSELTINHNRDQSPKSDLGLPPIDIAAAQQSNASSPALSPASASRGSAEVRTLHSASRFGRRRKTPTTPATPEMDDFPPPPSQSMSNVSINDENGTPKGSTRTSRWFKRVSTFNGSKRGSSAQSIKSTASFMSLESGPGSKTTNRASVATHNSDTPPAVVVGDLNVQFPDSLVRYDFPCIRLQG